ncbi:hypothetical protein C8R47DRAFT_1223073 [Mycena vitilis]|nr:hypothetical protein C8R47DRAFT_1223073 [Mycena vitilis]
MAFKIDLDAENVFCLLQELSEIRKIFRDAGGGTASHRLPGLDKFEHQLQLQYEPRAPSVGAGDDRLLTTGQYERPFHAGHVKGYILHSTNLPPRLLFSLSCPSHLAIDVHPAALNVHTAFFDIFNVHAAAIDIHPPTIGSDADIGYLGRQIVAPGAVQTRKGFRVDGVGPPVTLKAGVLLTQLLAIFSNHHAPNLLALLEYLQTTSQPPQRISGQSEMKALIADIQAMELNARANDLIYMCKLVQLVLNVDQLRIDRKREGKDKRTLGIVAVAALYGFQPARTFQNWHTWGSRLLHLCSAGTMYMLVVIAALGLRTTLTTAYHDAVKDINSLADALREVSDGKWQPLVRRLIKGIQYLRQTSVPFLDDYRFVRGPDTFAFTDVLKGDVILQEVQTCLFKLPARAPDWAISDSWAPHPPVIIPANVVVIKTGLRLKQSTALPFQKAKQKVFTEVERGFADSAVVPTSFEDFRTKLIDLHASGASHPGEYLELNSDIMGG